MKKTAAEKLLEEFGMFTFRNNALNESVHVGSLVSIVGDPTRRKLRVIKIWKEGRCQLAQVRDAARKREFSVPLYILRYGN